jgi:predicted membrane channel-forming protein YqfA (hemolysin III family)
MNASIAAQVFTVVTGIVIVFQACLAAGLPWGKASMGGKFQGKYPPKMRLLAIMILFILGIMAIIVLSRAGLILPNLMPFSKIAIYFVVVFFLAGTIMNAVSPSKIERIWAPLALLQMITSIIVALA